MKLYEFEGKKLFSKYGIQIPKGALLTQEAASLLPKAPVVLKAQLYTGDRMKDGGIVIAHTNEEARAGVESLFAKTIRKQRVSQVLAEECITDALEYYVSISYSSEVRGPVLAVSNNGGSGIDSAHLTTINIVEGLPKNVIQKALGEAGIESTYTDAVTVVVQKLWELFIAEHATLVEINPLFITKDGACIAGDAKVLLDDEKYNPAERRYIEMDGDIAILASGGGASMLNMDALLHAGGKPANYTEYSGNPPAEVVTELTKRVLSKPGLKGCWVVGAAANFTDIHTTLSGLLTGLLEIEPRPTYPIVIRRDGPHREEAFEMLQAAGKNYGFDFHLYDSSTPMVETAKIMTELAYKK